MAFRIVQNEFWTDSKVVEQFSPEDRLFFLYLITNPQTKQLGIYPLIPKIASFQLGWSEETVRTMIERFVNYKLIVYSEATKEVAVKNYLRHSITTGGQPVLDCLTKDAASVKDLSLLRYVLEANFNARNKTVKRFVVEQLGLLNDNDNDNDNEESSRRFADDSLKASVINGLDEKPTKTAFGEYGWIKLTDAQHNKFIADFGESEFNRCVTHIDESAQSTGNKNKWKDWNLVLRRCHRDGWGLKVDKFGEPVKVSNRKEKILSD